MPIVAFIRNKSENYATLAKQASNITHMQQYIADLVKNGEYVTIKGETLVCIDTDSLEISEFEMIPSKINFHKIL